MFIFFGWGHQRIKDHGPAAIIKCHGCFETCEWSLIEIYSYAHIFFIPFAKYDNRYFLECNNCRKSSFEIYDDQVVVAKETSKAFKAYKKGKISKSEFEQIIEKNKELRIIEAQDDTWKYPECNSDNSNSIYKCKNCGYNVV